MIIESREYWVKVVDFLQENWALIDEVGGEFIVWFIGQRSDVFDELRFASRREAEMALRRNGFHLWKPKDRFPAPPAPPFHRGKHPNGRIYSSGRFWR